MRKAYEGFLLLEAMVAMVVIVSGVLFMVSTIMFILSENKRCEQELEGAILLYEMACELSSNESKTLELSEKAREMGMTIVGWTPDFLRIESESLSMEIKREGMKILP